MKSLNKYPLDSEGTIFLYEVMNKLVFETDRHMTELKRQIRSINGRKEACRFLLNKMYKLSAKEKFHYFLVYETKKDTKYMTYSVVIEELQKYARR